MCFHSCSHFLPLTRDLTQCFNLVNLIKTHKHCPSFPCPASPLSFPPTFEADVQGYPGQRSIDDVTQVNLLLLIEVEFPAPTRGEPERNELLSMEAIQWLSQERERQQDEKGAHGKIVLTPRSISVLCVPITSTFFSFSA